jgi:hypothetical protein
VPVAICVPRAPLASSLVLLRMLIPLVLTLAVPVLSSLM